MPTVIIGIGKCGSCIAALCRGEDRIVITAHSKGLSRDKLFVDLSEERNGIQNLATLMERIVSAKRNEGLVHVTMIASPAGSAAATALPPLLSALRKYFTTEEVKVTTVSVMPHRVMLGASMIENVSRTVPVMYDESDHLILVDNSKIPGKSFFEINQLISKIITFSTEHKLTLFTVSGSKSSLAASKSCVDLLSEFSSRSKWKKNELNLLLNELK